jgi:8-oxo-dGTP pyrophosphatase MutT (NUDIX family)
MSESASISVPLKNGWFNFRVAGIAIFDGKILLHKTEDDQFWSLPGGRVEMFEFSKETLLREMMEETGLEVKVGELRWIVENFFEYNGRLHHEVGFYYLMNFLYLPDQSDFVVRDGDNELIFRWFNISDVAAIKIYPEFISTELLSGSESFAHFSIALKNLHQ